MDLSCFFMSCEQRHKLSFVPNYIFKYVCIASSLGRQTEWLPEGQRIKGRCLPPEGKSGRHPYYSL